MSGKSGEFRVRRISRTLNSIKLKVNDMPLREDHFYVSPPQVLKPLKTGALVEVVRDNINIMSFTWINLH